MKRILVWRDCIKNVQCNNSVGENKIDLCASSEQEVKQHLASCEARLEEMDKQTAERTQGLKGKTSALQWELRSLDQALSYSQPQNNIAQLQQHWHSLKVYIYNTSFLQYQYLSFQMFGKGFIEKKPCSLADNMLYLSSLGFIVTTSL